MIASDQLLCLAVLIYPVVRSTKPLVCALLALQGYCWNVENGTACVYKNASGQPLLVATVGKSEVVAGTKATVTTLPPVSFEAAPKCEGDIVVEYKERDESGRYWGWEVRLCAQ